VNKLIAIIRFPMVMTKNTVEAREYIGFIHGFFAPFSVREKVCPFFVRRAM